MLESGGTTAADIHITSDPQYHAHLQMILYITRTLFENQAFHPPRKWFHIMCLCFFKGNAHMFFSSKDHPRRRDSD